MNFFDVRTIVLINVVTDCLCTLVLVSLWLQNRNRFKGTCLWASDFLLQTAALSLVVLRGVIPDWLSVMLPNNLIIAGAFLGYTGLERFLGVRSPQTHNFALLAVFVCVQGYFSLIQPALQARNLNLSLGLILITAQCAWLLLGRVAPGQRRMTRGTGIVFIGFCLASLFRLIVILSGGQPENEFFRSGLHDTLVIISYQVLLLLLAYSLTLMVNQRLLMDIQAEKEKFTKAFRLSPYAITLTRMSDGCILEVNEGFSHITGFTPEEVVGRTTLGLRLWENEEDRAAVVDQLARDKKVREKESRFRTKSGRTIIGLFSAEVIVIDGSPWVLSVILDITERTHAQTEREQLLTKLQNALSEVKKLSGLLPICAHCKKIRDDKGYWNQIESFIQEHSEARFSHGICKECSDKYFPELNLYGDARAAP